MDSAKRDPKLLAMVVLAGAAFCMGGFFLSFLPLSDMDNLRRVALLSPSLAGVIVSFMAERWLSKLYRNDTWTDEELAPTRALVAKPVWSWIAGTMFAMIMLLCLVTPHRWLFINLAWFPLSVLSSMKRLLLPDVTPTDTLGNLTRSKPLRSDQWGQRKREELLPSWPD